MLVEYFNHVHSSCPWYFVWDFDYRLSCQSIALIITYFIHLHCIMIWLWNRWFWITMYLPDHKQQINLIISCSDGLHFTPFGNKILFDEVQKTLESIGLSQHVLRSDLPLFCEIDPKDPLKALEIWTRQPHGFVIQKASSAWFEHWCISPD